MQSEVCGGQIMKYIITYYDTDKHIQVVEIDACNPIHAIQIFEETEDQDNIISLVSINY